MAEVPDTVDDAIEELSETPTTDEVFFKTLPFQGREIASAAVSMAAAGGGSDLWANIAVISDAGDDSGSDTQWNLSATAPFSTYSRQTMVCTALTLEANDLAVVTLQVPNDPPYFPGNPPNLGGKSLEVLVEICVSNVAGTEKLVVDSDGAIAITTASKILAVSSGSIVEQIGSDLTINGAGIIKSTAGGQFSVRANVQGLLT